MEVDSRGGLPGLLDSLAGLHAVGEVGVLGIVLATAGSTYQKVGALVLLDAAGMIHGAISGGCLEPEIEDRAREVVRSGCALTLEFDTRSDEDLIFGSGTGCRGRINLLLLPQAPASPLTEALLMLASEGGTLEVEVSIEGPRIGRGTARLDARTWSWSSDGQPRLPDESSTTEAGGATAALRIAAPARILLLGAGPETAALGVFARRLGWLLQVVEHRGRWLKFVDRATIQQVIELPPADAARSWSEQRLDAAVVMTHNYALDLQHLGFCARSGLGYVHQRRLKTPEILRIPSVKAESWGS